MEMSRETTQADDGLQPSLQDFHPVAELATDGPDVETCVREAIESLTAKPTRDAATGQFIPGGIAAGKTLARSEQWWAAVADVKRELVAKVRADAALDGEAPETLSGLFEAYAEVRLLRQAMFIRLTELGGPITTKGKARALYTAYLGALDRETRLATTLGTDRRQKPAVSPLDYINGKADV